MKFYQWTALLGAVVLSACTSITDLKTDVSERLFGRQSTEIPSELNEIKSTVQAKVLWSSRLDMSEDDDFTPAVDNGYIYAAGSKGEVIKLSASSGKQEWRVNLGEAITGGVGIGANLVLVGTQKG